MQTPASHATFRKTERIAKRVDFTRTYETGRKQFGKHVVVFARPNDLEVSRIGITVTKKIGKANLRNRLKRWVREVYRNRRSELPSAPATDFVVNLKHSAAAATFTEFSDDLTRTLRKAAAALSSLSR